MMRSAAAPTRLLDLPDELLERILVAASDGGRLRKLWAAHRACSRLRAIACRSARVLRWTSAFCCDDSGEDRTWVPLLPRLSGITDMRFEVDLEDWYTFYPDSFACLPKLAEAVGQHCRGVTDFWVHGSHPVIVAVLMRGFGLLPGGLGFLDYEEGDPRWRLPALPSPLPMGGGGAAGLPFPLLTTLSLAWPGTLREPLAPLARLTRLTALELHGHARAASKSDWLPPNLEELYLGVDDGRNQVKLHNRLRGIGGAGWLAALNAGACPRLRALHLTKLAVRDVRPAGRRAGLTLANTLPRLTALEELDASVYECTYKGDYLWGLDDDGYFNSDDHAWDDEDEDAESEDDDNDNDGGSDYFSSSGGGSDWDCRSLGSSDDDVGGAGAGNPQVPAWAYALPFPAAPLLAALPSLRRCHAVFLRWGRELDGEGSLLAHCRTKAMMFATPAELAGLHAPKLESLTLSLIDGNRNNELFCYCNSSDYGSDMDGDDDGDDDGDADGGAVAPPNAAAADAPQNAAAAVDAPSNAAAADTPASAAAADAPENVAEPAAAPASAAAADAPASGDESAAAPASAAAADAPASGEEPAAAPASAAAAATAAATIGAGSSMPALQSLELHVGCPRWWEEDDASLDLSGLTPGSLPALRRLLALPRRFNCRGAEIELDAVSRAAPRLERLVIDPRCAGPLGALFCDGGCGALSLRALTVLPPLDSDDAAPARINDGLRAGLLKRAAAGVAPPLKVRLLTSDLDLQSGAVENVPVERARVHGATVVRRAFSKADGRYVGEFSQAGPWVNAYERAHA